MRLLKLRSRSSRPMVAGLLLLAAAIISVPLFVAAGEGDCSIPNPASSELPSSWDCYQAFVFDFRIPILIAAFGGGFMLVSVVRAHRSRHNSH